MTAPIITLLSDFGLEDPYVASMKGVILGICPDARLVDISHQVPPQDVRAGAFLLACAYKDFPPGTIHLAVVDPEVGTDRRGLLVRADRHYFVGPDNGLCSWLWREGADREAYSLECRDFWRPVVSQTFHGRDIFAPVAAHLGMGVTVQAFGSPCTPRLATWAQPAESHMAIHGEVIHIDRFGNAVTNITGEVLDRLAPRSELAVHIAGLTVSPVIGAYAAEKIGSPVALIGGANRLEIAVNQGHAAREYGICGGDPVSVTVRRAR